MSSNNDSPVLFARSDVKTELRGECPKDIVAVLDAVAMARQVSRTEIVNEVLGTWAENKLHEVNLINRVMRRNPTCTDEAGDTQ